MRFFKLTKKRKDKKKKSSSTSNYSDFLYIIGDIIIWPLRLLWYLLEIFGRMILAILEGIGEFFSGL